MLFLLAARPVEARLATSGDGIRLGVTETVAAAGSRIEVIERPMRFC